MGQKEDQFLLDRVVQMEVSINDLKQFRAMQMQMLEEWQKLNDRGHRRLQSRVVDLETLLADFRETRQAFSRSDELRGMVEDFARKTDEIEIRLVSLQLSMADVQENCLNSKVENCRNENASIEFQLNELRSEFRSQIDAINSQFE